MQKKDIQDLADIRLLVDSFYEKVRADAVLAPIFDEKIGDNWPAHLEKMYKFWQTLLLKERTYQGSPFPPHAFLPIGESHFQIWLSLFYQTLEELFEGETALEARIRATKIAEVFLAKITYLREATSLNLSGL